MSSSSTARAQLVDTKLVKHFAIACLVVPGALLAIDAWRGTLGVNGINYAIRSTGLLGIVALVLALAITPLRKLTGWPILIGARRNLGVAGFLYIAAHFTIFFVWDREASVGGTLAEIIERVYLWFGTAALVFMIPLAITSTDGMVTRLGAKRWKLLHRLTYVVVAGGLVHYWLLVKADTTKPLAFTIAASVVMLARLLPTKRPAVVTSKRWRGKLRIAAITDETHDVKTFRFVTLDGAPIPFEHVAGQYLNLAFEIAGRKVYRSYTIASPPTRRDHVEISVKRAPNGNGGSRYIHDTFAVGDVIDVSAPSGEFFFRGTEAKRVVMIAGGVGITPMISVIRAMTDRAWSGRMDLVFAVREARDVIFERELDTLAAKHPNLHVHVVISSERGHLSAKLLEELVPGFAGSPVMMCGPAPMMVATRKFLVEELGIADGTIHEERFVSTPIGSAAPADGTFDIAFAKSAKRADKVALTILEAAEECGVAIDYECRSGICGQCKTKLVSGQVAMDITDALTSADRTKGLVLACQARPIADVVVDA